MLCRCAGRLVSCTVCSLHSYMNSAAVMLQEYVRTADGHVEGAADFLMPRSF